MPEKKMNHRRHLLSFFLKLSLITGALFVLHYYILLQSAGEVALLQMLTRNYIFIGLINLLSYVLIYYLVQRAPGKGGFAFLGLSLLKIMISVAYLYAPLQNLSALQEMIILNFMAPYMILLFAEVFWVHRLLKQSIDGEG